jgi:hypothetical protein
MHFFHFYLCSSNLSSKSNKQAVSQWYGSADPDLDLNQNVTDPQHWF